MLIEMHLSICKTRACLPMQNIHIRWICVLVVVMVPLINQLTLSTVQYLHTYTDAQMILSLCTLSVYEHVRAKWFALNTHLLNECSSTTHSWAHFEAMRYKTTRNDHCNQLEALFFQTKIFLSSLSCHIAGAWHYSLFLTYLKTHKNGLVHMWTWLHIGIIQMICHFSCTPCIHKYIWNTNQIETHIFSLCSVAWLCLRSRNALVFLLLHGPYAFPIFRSKNAFDW